MFFLPIQKITIHATEASNIAAVAAQVSARNFLPLYAYRPISLPYWLIKSVALTIIAVTIALDIASARNATIAKRKLQHDVRRPVEKKETSARMMHRPAAAAPMQYSTNIAVMATLKALIPFLMSSE